MLGWKVIRDGEEEESWVSWGRKKTKHKPKNEKKNIYAILLQLKRRNNFISPWETRRWLHVAAASAAELLGPAESAVCETEGIWGAEGGVWPHAR